MEKYVTAVGSVRRWIGRGTRRSAGRCEGWGVGREGEGLGLGGSHRYVIAVGRVKLRIGRGTRRNVSSGGPSLSFWDAGMKNLRSGSRGKLVAVMLSGWLGSCQLVGVMG